MYKRIFDATKSAAVQIIANVCSVIFAYMLLQARAQTQPKQVIATIVCKAQSLLGSLTMKHAYIVVILLSKLAGASHTMGRGVYEQLFQTLLGLLSRLQSKETILAVRHETNPTK